MRIVYGDWVEDSAAEGQWLDTDPYAVPPFAGLFVVDTGLSALEREAVRHAVETGGGTFR
jgi:hypothetical protein